MSDFAKAQLLKYGWTEGRGLGKNESGIAEALKPKLKFDTAGIGHDPAEQFTYHWWENVFDRAAKNISIDSSADGVTMNVLDADAVDITTKKSSLKALKKCHAEQYGNFLKTSTLLQDGSLHREREAEEESIPVPKPKASFEQLTDEDLFKACGGRTAHKGARHGLNLNGKLARIAEQEKQLLASMNAASTENADLKTEETGENLTQSAKWKRHRRRRKAIEIDPPEQSTSAKPVENEIEPQPSCSYIVDLTPDDDFVPAKSRKKSKKRAKMDTDDVSDKRQSKSTDDNANTIADDDFVIPQIQPIVRSSSKSKKGKKRERRRITELTEQLDSACVIDESESTPKKRKRDKNLQPEKDCERQKIVAESVQEPDEADKLNRRISKRKKYTSEKKQKHKLETITKELMSVNLTETLDSETNGKENANNCKKYKESKKSKTSKTRREEAE